ncbi:non-homologous end-joining DNA ligase [Nocardia terpenica]|uniref:ATP-dependent DNA ligase n=1 Tax=Nocardia terpenica TaxID=455432 RepID=A0A6G9Z667_9NOCA|nr:non-homologous end-joining DNA ligase [Nocardia terpenica]QIS20950.1 ATP-dependent DNA ligase [Nocardia terpenica]
MARIDVEVTHAERELFPDDGITKGELVDYYCAIAPVMLPHLRDRPLTLQRFPRGIGEQGFIQQDFADAMPEWMSRAEVGKRNGTVVHAVADRREALAWLANQDCITVHSWLSRGSSQPDRLVFDLDPTGSDFSAVRATARTCADVLDDLGLAAFVQTTGSRGLHVVAPLRADADFDTVREFARGAAEVVAADDPRHRTVEIRKDKRGDRVYIDVMRNAYAQTAVAPYAVRARPGAPVATPLDWSELDDRALRPDRYTLRDIPERVTEHGDPWADLPRHARSLTRPRQRLQRLHPDSI